MTKKKQYKRRFIEDDTALNVKEEMSKQKNKDKKENYCKCKYRKQKTCNYEGIIFIEGNKGYCEKCEKPIHHKTIMRLFK